MKSAVLGLDCTGETYSVGLWSPQGPHLEVSGFTPRRALREIPAAMESVLATAGITAGDLAGIGVTQGPGSFTGVRLGVTVAKTLALVAGCPVVAWDTLELLAHQGLGESGVGTIVVALDARRGELYGGMFARRQLGDASLETLLPTDVYSPRDFATKINDLGPFQAAMGGGVAAYPEILSQDWVGSRFQGREEAAPSGYLVAKMSAFVKNNDHRLSADDLWPVYCRRADIQVSSPPPSLAIEGNIS